VDGELLFMGRDACRLTRDLLREGLHLLTHGGECVSKRRQVGSVRIGLLGDTDQSRALRPELVVEPFDLLAQRDESLFQRDDARCIQRRC
jgi:hypothetical protein